MNRNPDWSKIIAALADSDNCTCEPVEPRPDNFTEEEEFDRILEFIDYDDTASVDIADDAKRQCFFNHWAKRSLEWSGLSSNGR